MGKHKKHSLFLDTDSMKGQEVLELFKKEFPTADIATTPLTNDQGVYGHKYTVTLKPGFAQYGFTIYSNDVVYTIARYRYKGPNDPPENYDVWIDTILATVDTLKKDFNIMHEMLKQGRYLTVVEEDNVNRVS